MTPTKCCERVWSKTTFPKLSPCSFTAKVERDGKPYCKIHDPVFIASKREKMLEKVDREIAESMARHEIDKKRFEAYAATYGQGIAPAAVAGLLEALEKCAKALDSGFRKNMRDASETARAALAKARGEK